MYLYSRVESSLILSNLFVRIVESTFVFSFLPSKKFPATKAAAIKIIEIKIMLLFLIKSSPFIIYFSLSQKRYYFKIIEKNIKTCYNKNKEEYMDDGSGGLAPKLILIFILTLINAFFSAAELAIVSANKTKIETLSEKGDNRAKTLLKVTEDQTRFLSTIQVGITLAGFFSSASAATSVSKMLGHYFMEIGIYYGPTLALIIVTFILSFFTLVFGELVPKRIALQNAESVALFTAKPIQIFTFVTYPFVKLASVATTLTLKAMGKYSEDVEEKISEEELKGYIKVSTEQGVINSQGEEMIVKIMDFDDRLAYEIMTPRTNIYMLDYDEFNVDVIPEMLSRGYSRVPVYRENTDNIVGTIYLKDLFMEYAKNDYKSVDIDNVLKEPYFVPETKKIDSLLKELQESKSYLAILIDEYGGFSGMVTMEDIVEEIVGEIEDEYDKDEPKIEKVKDDLYIIDGRMNLEDINDELGTELESENHETISGLMVELLGFIPDDSDKIMHSVKYKNIYTLTELTAKDKRIEKIELKIEEPPEGEGKDEEEE